MVVRKRGGQRARSSRVSGRPAVTDRKREAGREPVHDSFEALLDKSVAHNAHSASGLHALLYGATRSLNILGYKYGFTVGRTLHSRHKRIESLFAILERGGLGKVLYTPSSDKSYIRSSASGNQVMRIEAGRVHYYEAGMIAGFLSSHTKAYMRTEETSCVMSGDPECTFVSSTTAPISYGGLGRGPDSLVKDMAEVAKGRKGSGASDYYTYLSMQPLLSGRISEKLAGLMFAAGRELRVSSHESIGEIVKTAGLFIGAGAKMVKNTKAKKSIVLRYNSFGSVGYVALTSPIFAGAVGGEYKAGRTYSRLKDGAYSVRIDFRI